MIKFDKWHALEVTVKRYQRVQAYKKAWSNFMSARGLFANLIASYRVGRAYRELLKFRNSHDR